MILFFTLKLGLATLLGSLIGLERQYRQKSAGLRTNTLVCLGSTAFVLLSVSLTGDDTFGDPTRIAGQIVTGIGFLGAGVIMKTGMNVSGLNTAATIWCSASVGTLVGAGLYFESVILTFFVLLTHIGLRSLSLLLKIPRRNIVNGDFTYYINITCKEEVENHLRLLVLDVIKKHSNLKLRSLKNTTSGVKNHVDVEFSITSRGRSDDQVDELLQKLTIEYGVNSVNWEFVGSDDDEE